MPVLASAILILSVLRWELPLVLLMATLILAAAERTRQGLQDPLAKAGMIYLGEISYSIYMVHLPVATILLRGAIIMLGTLQVWVILLAILVTIGVAAASHRLIEVPTRRWISQLGIALHQNPHSLRFPGGKRVLVVEDRFTVYQHFLNLTGVAVIMTCVGPLVLILMCILTFRRLQGVCYRFFKR